MHFQARILTLLPVITGRIFVIFTLFFMVLGPTFASNNQNNTSVPAKHLRYLAHYSEFVGYDLTTKPEIYMEWFRLADSEDAIHEKALACLNLSSACYELGLYETGAYFAAKGIGEANAVDDNDVIMQLLDIKAFNMLALGKTEEANEHLRGLIRLAEAAGNVEWSMYALLRTSHLQHNSGNLERSADFLAAAADYVERVQNDALVLSFYTQQILQALATNDEKKATNLLEEIIRNYATNQFPEVYGLISLYDSNSLFRLDNEALFIEEGLKQAESGNNIAKILWFKKLNADFLSNTDDKNKAYRYLNEVIKSKQDIFSQKNKHRNQFNNLYADYLKSKSVKTKDSNLLSYLPPLIFILLLLSLTTIILLLLKKLYKRKHADKKSIIKQVNNLTISIETANDKIEDRVAERKLALETELSEREKVDVELKVALKKAEEANYLKNAFLSNMSHEIRTPLNGILGFSSLLELELALQDNKELFEYAKSIQESGGRLLHLLNNIIDISRIEANDLVMKISGYSISTILDEAIGLYSFKANEKGLSLVKKYENDCHISVDRNTLSRVICEILDNAIKFTEKGFIRVETMLNKDINRLVVIIKDTGIGIDDTYLPHIFEAFRQESLGYSKLYQGAGLGLPLAGRMVDLMGGRIRLESQKSIGTTVYLEFKVEENSLVTEKQAGESVFTDKPLDLKNLNIFVVEDDVSNMKLLKKMVEPIGMVYAANDGEQALKLLSENMEKGKVMDLFLLDINLPAPWDGIKLMQSIKHRYTAYENSLFIAITAYAMSGDRERIIDAGFTDYIPKPIERESLHEILRNNWQMTNH